MANVRVDERTDRLYLDFRYQGKRYREFTGLKNTSTNTRTLERLGKKVEQDIVLGAFKYHSYFPNSAAGQRFAKEELAEAQQAKAMAAAAIAELQSETTNTPLFKDFVEEWIIENKISWRDSHLTNMRNIVKCHYLSRFGNREVGSITRAELLKFRSDLAKVPGRTINKGLSANRINKIMDPLRRVFEEAADRYEFNTPFTRIKPLRIQRSDVEPFTLAESLRIIAAVRPDYKNYYIVRFFTGMRTGEIDGLKWKYVDFERKQILVRETIVAGKEDYTKTDASQREIYMTDAVYRALKHQHKATSLVSEFVFCNLKGTPLDHNNITKRVWYPLLAKLKLEKRRPYQTRHTAATLWLAAGEAPEWIARQMGHASTEMLFKVYSRYVPNLTRKDGSAFERLLDEQMSQLGN